MLLIKNGKLMTMNNRLVIDGGDILIDGDRICNIGQGLKADNAEVIDAKGGWVLPGFIDPHCHIGIDEDGNGPMGVDVNEAIDPVTPDMRAIDAINPLDMAYEDALRYGITLVATGPGSANVIGGQFVLMNTFGNTIDDMTVNDCIALKTAFGENPKRCYGDKGKTPRTRMATAAIFRENFIKAQEYIKKQADEDPAKRPACDLKLEAICKALRGEIIVKSHAHRADDIATALRLGKEFGLRQTIDHCTEGYLILDTLKKYNATCLLGPIISSRSKIELRNKSNTAPAAFEKAGVRFAFLTDHPVIPIELMTAQAAICVREGLSEMGALEALTINAALALGIEKDYGSLEIGKKADISIFENDPLDIRSRTTTVIGRGKVVYAR